MRQRDVNAILFCMLTTGAVLIGTFVLLHSWAAAAVITAAYDAFILTRPRMLRIYRRMRGETVDRFNYHVNR